MSKVIPAHMTTCNFCKKSFWQPEWEWKGETYLTLCPECLSGLPVSNVEPVYQITPPEPPRE